MNSIPADRNAWLDALSVDDKVAIVNIGSRDEIPRIGRIVKRTPTGQLDVETTARGNTVVTRYRNGAYSAGEWSPAYRIEPLTDELRAERNRKLRILQLTKAGGDWSKLTDDELAQVHGVLTAARQRQQNGS